MSDRKVKDILAELEEQKKNDPVIEGVAALAAHAVDSERRNIDQFKRAADRDEEIEAKIEKANAQLDTKMEQGFSLVQEKLEKVYSRNSAIGAIRGSGAIYDVTDPLLAAMPEAKRKSIGRFDVMAGATPKESEYSDPIVRAAATQWFAMSTRLQLSKFSADHSQIAPDFHKLNQAFADVAKAARVDLTEGTAAEGGNLVPTIVEKEIIRLVLDAGSIFPLCRRVQMTANSHSFPSETTGVQISWPLEEGAATTGEPIFGSVALKAVRIGANAIASIELLDDSSVALLPYLQSVFAEKIANELDFQVVEGTTPFTGINTAAGVNAVTLHTTTGSTAPSYANLVSTFVAGGESSTRQTAVWIMSPGVFGVVAGMVDSNGQPVLKLGDASGTLPMSIFGRPVIVHNRCAIGTSAATGGTNIVGQIYFGPPDKLIAGYKQGLRWDVSDAPNWSTYKINARMMARFGFVVGHGASWTKVTKLQVSAA